MASIVYTVGHSNHTMSHFLTLLQAHSITVVADVRSVPYSRRNPQFNRDTIATPLAAAAIDYVPIGKELGARPDDPCCYVGGRVQYELVSRSTAFAKGLQRIVTGAANHRIALMCAEKEPLHCHRALLVARRLVEHGVSIRHILADSSLETHESTLSRLLASLGMPPADLFRTPEDIMAEAYRIQSGSIVSEDGESRG